MKDIEKTGSQEWGTEYPHKFYHLGYTTRRDENPHFERISGGGYGFEDEIMYGQDRPELQGVRRVAEFVRRDLNYTGVTFRKGPFVGQAHGRLEEHMNRPHSVPQVLFYEKAEEEADYVGVMAAALWAGHNFNRGRRESPGSTEAISYVYDRLPGFQKHFDKGFLSSPEKMSEAYRNNEHIRDLVKFSLDQLQNGKNGVIRIPDQLIARFKAQSQEACGNKYSQLILFFALMEIIQGEDDFSIYANLLGNQAATEGLGDMNVQVADHIPKYFGHHGIHLIDVPGKVPEMGTPTELANLVDDLIMKEGVEGLRKRLHEGQKVDGRKKRFAKLFPGNPAFKEDPVPVEKPKPVEVKRTSVGDQVRAGLKKFFG